MRSPLRSFVKRENRISESIVFLREGLRRESAKVALD